MIKELKSPYQDTLIYELDSIISQFEIDIIEKGIEETLLNYSKVNLMININVEGESLGSFIKEFSVGIKYWNKIDKIAYVGDKKKHLKFLVEIDNLFTKFKEKYFDIDEIDKAWNWLKES